MFRTGRTRRLVAAWLAVALSASPSLAQPPGAPTTAPGARDFDFEFGTWKMQLRRRLKPLTGSDDWVRYEGVSTVRPIWGGRANLGEIDLSGPTGRLQGLSLRLFDPRSGQWRVSFANPSGGQLGPPMIGGFKAGRGEFYNQESFNGRAIFVRFVFSEITPTAFHFEQAFSADGGKTWEANWIAQFRR